MAVKAQIKQLQGFLLLFDQTLANHFQQLEQIRSLLALPDPTPFRRIDSFFQKIFAKEKLSQSDWKFFREAVMALPTTHASQPVEGVHQIKELLGGYIEDYTGEKFKEETEAPFSSEQLNRLLRLYDHLLARFHETLPDPGLLQYAEVIRSRLSEEKENDELFLKKMILLKQVSDRALLLSDYPLISRRRCGSCDYLSKEEQGNAVLSRRIAYYLGIPQFRCAPLAKDDREGVHLLEAVLLRHVLEKELSDLLYAPLHNQLYFVIPQWPLRFARPDFKKVMEEVIYRETPVHLEPRLIYLDREKMDSFENSYYEWLNAMTKFPVDTNAIPETPNESAQEDLALISEQSIKLLEFLQP